MFGFGDIMGKVQELQANMKQVKEELAKEVIEASSGGGMVTVKMNGKFEVLSLKIDKNAVDVDDLEMLEDLIKAAFNNAISKSAEVAKEKMTQATGGLSVPGIGNISDMLGNM